MCTKRDNGSTDEIEVTPEMIEAGLDVCARARDSIGDVEIWAIFKGMLAVCPSLKHLKVI